MGCCSHSQVCRIVHRVSNSTAILCIAADQTSMLRKTILLIHIPTATNDSLLLHHIITPIMHHDMRLIHMLINYHDSYFTSLIILCCDFEIIVLGEQLQI